MRLRSLDLFRGATVAAMILVNNPGDWNAVYWPLLHAEWHGWTPTDLVFPFFLFIVGVALPFGSTTTARLATIVRRALVLFGLGLFLAGFPFFDLATWRVPGVLQRIAVCYFAAAIVLRWEGQPRRRPSVAAVLAAVCLLGSWALMARVAPPGGTAGDLTAEGNLGAWLDRQLFGGHLWKTRWDPEGLLSTIPAVGTTLLGVVAGLLIKTARSSREVVRRLAIGGLAGVLCGLLWDTVWPINKSLWTSSYALFTAGVAAASLAACYWFADIDPPAWRLVASEPFVAMGRNALILFVVSGLLAKTLVYLKWPDPAMSLGHWLYVTLFSPFAPPRIASLAYALAHLALLAAVAWALHQRRRYLTA